MSASREPPGDPGGKADGDAFGASQHLRETWAPTASSPRMRAAAMSLKENGGAPVTVSSGVVPWRARLKTR